MDQTNESPRNQTNCNESASQNEQTHDDRVAISHQISNAQSPHTPRSLNLAIANVSHESAESRLLRTLPLVIRPSLQTSITCQLRSNLPSPISLVPANQPPTLFLQALSKLNESSISLAVLSKLKTPLRNSQLKSGELSPPDSLASAPPSYSFVLRQMAARRRPRLMGTFIPSPSFVQHTPPPNYATAFDIYVDNPVPPPPRVYHFGFASMPAVCPECGYAGMTVVTTKITMCTHMCAFLLCLFCCWICVPLPYILRSCKDVYHHCRGCRNYLGMYCPTNPDNSPYT